MLKKFGFAALVAVCLAFGPAAVMTSGTAAAKTCKTEFISAWGSRKNTMYGARISATNAWKRASKLINGTKYDTWWPSKRKSMKCFTNRDGKKRCKARARPCTIL